uniref:Uncharacterized protein n=1 Tax=viral metagenome TaxID=1070528 RepID=A0A6C0ET35_9ZZZZ
MIHSYNKLHKKIIYYFIIFIVFIKFIYLFFFILTKYLKIDYKIQYKIADNKNVNNNIVIKNDEKLQKIIYYKTIAENIFIISTSILLIYLFYPYHNKNIINEYLNDVLLKLVIFIYGIVILITFDWRSFSPEFI